MPTVDGRRLDQHQGVPPRKPRPSQQQPQQTIRGAKAAIRASEDGQLVPQGKHLKQEVSTRRQGQPYRGHRSEHVTHCA
jgi:hypothetical protein